MQSSCFMAIVIYTFIQVFDCQAVVPMTSQLPSPLGSDCTPPSCSHLLVYNPITGAPEAGLHLPLGFIYPWFPSGCSIRFNWPLLAHINPLSTCVGWTPQRNIPSTKIGMFNYNFGLSLSI